MPVRISDICNVLTAKHKIKKADYLEFGETPVIDQSQNFIAGYTNEKSEYSKGDYIVYGDHTNILKYITFPFSQGADGIKVIKTNNNLILLRYLYFCMTNIDMPKGYTRHWSKMKENIILLIPIEKQNEIINILNKFDLLCTDLTNGLPAEIEAREKQYQYYRDKLLLFDEIALK